MPRIGVRELKIHVSEVVRDVRDAHARYVVTHRGQPVAVIVPYSPLEAGDEPTREQAWAEFWKVAEAAGRGWKSPLTSVQILDQIRR